MWPRTKPLRCRHRPARTGTAAILSLTTGTCDCRNTIEDDCGTSVATSEHAFPLLRFQCGSPRSWRSSQRHEDRLLILRPGRHQLLESASAAPGTKAFVPLERASVFARKELTRVIVEFRRPDRPVP